MQDFYDLYDTLRLQDWLSRDRKTILIVDDNPDVLLFTERVLAKADAELVVARSVEAAIEFLKCRTPDLLLTDLYFPQKSGFALLDYVRRSTRLASMPALAMSSKRSPECQALAKKFGAAEFIAKPFAPRELLSSVTAYI